MKEITREEALRLFFKAIDHDDPYWENLMQDFYDEESENFPSQWQVGKALGFSVEEMERACGVEPGRLIDLGVVDEDQKYHWYMVTSVNKNKTRDSFMGLMDRNVKRSDIHKHVEGKSGNGPIIINLSYLGHMTREEFLEEETE